jgi:hypothetical protein
VVAEVCVIERLLGEHKCRMLTVLGNLHPGEEGHGVAGELRVDGLHVCGWVIIEGQIFRNLRSRGMI